MSSPRVSPRPEALKNEIVEIRRQAASSVFDSLQTALESIQTQATCISELQSAIMQDKNDLDQAAQALGDDVTHMRRTLNRIYGNDVDSDVNGVLQNFEGHVNKLQSALKQARQKAKELVRHHVESQRLTERGRKFQDEKKLALRRATEGDPLKELKKIWEEGLDLLSGLCLRNEGLDRGLCRFADAIIAEIDWAGIKAITVPGRGGPGHLTSIVHLRFPEWTAWALPLTAHELWHLGRLSNDYGKGRTKDNQIRAEILETLSGTDPDAKERLESSIEDWSIPELQVCLADVFGVHVMGPAYACAAIWLVLDPEERESKQRALSIFRALRSDPSNTYEEIHNNLETQWRQASKNSGIGELEYSEWIDALLMYLNENSLKFDTARWRALRQKWPEALRTGEIKDLDDLTKNDFRYALTAAWKARLEWPDNAADIADNCGRLCERILGQSQTQTQPKSQMIPGAR